MSTTAAGIAAAALLWVAGPPSQDGRLPVPDDAAQKRIEKSIREVFKDEYLKKDPAGRRAFGQKLLSQARESKDDSESRYGLLKEAIEVAVQVGDVATCLAASDELAQAFAVPALPLKKASLDKAKKAVAAPADCAALAEAYLELAARAAKAEDSDLAAEAAKEAEAFAQKGKSIALVTKARSAAKEIAENRSDIARVAEARKKVSAAPEDPESHGVLGRHLCFRLAEWETGLAHLAKGPEGALKGLAARDLAAPAEAADQIRLGDAWWDAGEKETGGAREGCRRRAARWYLMALPGLTGLTRARLEKRIGEAPADARAAAPIPGLLGGWAFDEGSGEVARDFSGRNNHGKLMNGLGWSAGRTGSALAFDGKDDYIVFSAADLPAANASQTLSWSLYYERHPTGNQHIISIGSHAPASSVQVVHRGGMIAMTKFGGMILVSVPAGEERTWRHYAYTFDGTTHRLYVDGAFKSSSTVPPNAAKPSFFEIGRWPTIEQYSTPRIDDVRIFDRALSDAEIQVVAGRK